MPEHPTNAAIEMTQAEWDTHTIAMANDAFRQNPQPSTRQGKWVITAGVYDEGPDFVSACVCAVMAFDVFTEDNDPDGDHCFGTFDIEGKVVWWKIDLYDAAYQYGSDDPLDAAKTRRVLTILFPHEW